MLSPDLRRELRSWKYLVFPMALGGVAAGGVYVLANALTGTGLSPYGPSPQAVSSASPFPSHFAGEE
jgi:hypothetical protein